MEAAKTVFFSGGVTIMGIQRRRMLRFTLCALAALASAAHAQDSPETLDFPQDPRQWIHSQPWSFEQLKGKSALLLFFEEESAECQAKWAELNKLAQQHADDPILFIAVSSGTQRGQMEAYAQRYQANWAMLLDPDRSFEKACDVTPISLDNIMQVAIVMPDGNLQSGDWQDLETTVASALENAKWTVDPKTIPAVLKPAWQQIEFQNYSAAASAVRKSLKSSKAEIKTAAETLLAAVQPLIDEQAAAAEKAYDAGEKLSAFRAYSQLLDRFKGYELPETASDRKKQLQSDPQVKTELAALKTFEAAQKQWNNPAQKKKAIVLLKRLVKDKPDTEAGKKAQAMLDELNPE